MKIALCLLAAASLTLAACQADMTGTPRTSEAISAAPSTHADVAHGDAYLEEALDRYDLSK